MIEFFHKSEYNNVRKNYKGKIVITLPYAFSDLKTMRRLSKIYYIPKTIPTSFNPFLQKKYASIEYFLLISLTDIEDNIYKFVTLIKNIDELLGWLDGRNEPKEHSTERDNKR